MDAPDRPGRSCTKPVVTAVAPWLALFVLVALYNYIIAHVVIHTYGTALLYEYPLLMLLFTALYLPLRHRWFSVFAAAFPILITYGIHDFYLAYMGTLPDFVDARLIPTLFHYLSPTQTVLAAATLSVPVVAWLACLDVRRDGSRARRIGALAAVGVLGAYFAVVVYAPGAYVDGMAAVTRTSKWTPKRNVERYGRLTVALMREARRRHTRERLATYRPPDEVGLTLPPDVAASLDRRNVHLLVLESFFDPRRLGAVTFRPDPAPASFTALTSGSESTSISPTYGGNTAKAEFEVLCGVPSLELYDIELLVFGGGKTPCLPDLLAERGYATVSSVPDRPDIFNAERAYRSAGFQRRLFGSLWVRSGVTDKIAMTDKGPLFDGDLYAQNRELVRSLLADGKPFLNYVLTTYGHTPYHLDPKRHPSVISVSPAEAVVGRVTNQFHYRAAALADHVAQLRALDPRGIIIAVADHFPTLRGGEMNYKALKLRPVLGPPKNADHEVFLLMIDGGEVVHAGMMRHFDIPGWTLDRLSGGRYCRERRCDFGRWPFDAGQYQDAYQTIMGMGARRP